MIDGCPGAIGFKGAQELKIKICPECGEEIEIFSRDACMQCSCGFTAYNDSQTCLKWCKFARECIGEELYDKFLKRFAIP